MSKLDRGVVTIAIMCHLLLNKGHIDQQSGVVWIILILYLGLT